MRKRLIVTTATALLLLVSACGSSGSDSGGGDASASASKSGGGESANLDQVEWVEGEPPGLDFEAPFALDESFALEVVKEGSGEPAAAGSGISVNYVYYQGSDGSEIESTYQAGVPLSHELDSGVSGSDVLYRATVGQSAGAQIIVAWQANATGGSDGESESSDGPVTYLMALTLETVTPGETITPTDPALPTVVLAPSGRPSIVVPAGTDPPTELKREVFKEGDGAVVAATDSVSVNYTGWLWDGTQFDSSWDRGEPASFSLDGVIAGWTDGLTGVKVGSQVLLVVPPDMGYGEEGSGSIPGGSTLIFVVDLLAVE